MAEYNLKGNCAILRVDNPPVNALSHHVRLELKAGIEKAEKSNVIAIIIYGGNRFIAGADIREFSTGSMGREPNLTELCDIIEGSTKPVICAIEGYALGGGFEVAISSHYRIAHTKTQFGFPEVELGILPAATGTQRFPQLVGLKAALDYIPTGVRFSAAKALEIGAIDKVVSDNVLDDAIRFAQLIANSPVDARRTSKMQVKDSDKAQMLMHAAIKKVNQKYSGLLAPLFAIKSVMSSIGRSFEEGCELEQQFAVYLFTSGQSRALQYAFLSQRKATQWSLPDGHNFKNTQPRPIKSVAVIGGGAMGTGIAMALLNANLPVHLVEQNQEFLDRGIKILQSLYRGSVSLGHLTDEQVQQRMKNFSSSIDLKPLKNVDLVIEAVFEDLKLKQDIFSRLDKACKDDCILCTNTSGLSIDKIAAITTRPHMVVGTHFFIPAYYMKLLEIVRGQQTSATSIATAVHLAKLIGKIPVVVGNCQGFVANRMRNPLAEEAMFLLEEGCFPEDVDQTAEDFGFPMGPLKVTDLSGVDVGMRILTERARSVNEPLNARTRCLNGNRISPLIHLLYDCKRFGRKTGSGIYEYGKPGGKVPYKSDFVRQLLIEYRRENNIEKRSISTQEILERLLYGSINEGFKIIEEGIATSPEEIDTIWLLGFGWPRQSGGPMYYANVVGLPVVYERICHYNKQHTSTKHWQPSKLLESLVKNGISMSEWKKILSHL